MTVQFFQLLRRHILRAIADTRCQIQRFGGVELHSFFAILEASLTQERKLALVLDLEEGDLDDPIFLEVFVSISVAGEVQQEVEVEQLNKKQSVEEQPRNLVEMEADL
jgi:hypothetical protein